MSEIISVTEVVAKYGISRGIIKNALRRGEIGGFKESYRNILIYDDARLKAFANRILPIKPDAYPEYKTVQQIMRDYKVSYKRFKTIQHKLGMQSIRSGNLYYLKITDEFERALKKPRLRTGWRSAGLTRPQKDTCDRFIHANKALNQIIAAFR